MTRELLIRNGVSVVVPVTERATDLLTVLPGYVEQLGQVCKPLQIVVVLDGSYADLAETVRALDPHGVDFDVFALPRTFGESAALTIGFAHCKHDLILTLPAYEQVKAESIVDLFDYAGLADVVLGRRSSREDRGFNSFSGRLFHSLARRLTKVDLNDLGCGVRLLHKRVLDEIDLYGDQHRFFPILADRKGFRIVEVDLPQADSDKRSRIYMPGVYLSRFLDLLSVFFVARFTKKPLRFFGMLGSVLGLSGLIVLTLAAIQRQFFEIPLSDRPIILLGSLLLVLGVQLFALGLVGELIIFTHARNLREYNVAETVNFSRDNDKVA